MKFKVQSKAFYNAISAVSKVINSKNTMTILNNFLLEVNGENIVVTASDIENRISATLPVEDFEGEPGKFCLDARRLTELFKECPDVQSEISIDENMAVFVEFPGGKFDFVALNGDEYPQPENEAENAENIQKFTCPSEVILTGIANTAFASGTDDLRPQMMGVYFDIKPESITFVATDTRKLVKYEDKNVAPGITATCIVPSKPANVLRNVFGGEEEVNVGIDSKSASFSNGTFKFNCRLIKGMFPDYNRVIPASNPFEVIVDRRSLLTALRRVSVFVDPGHGLVKFNITPEQIEMRAQDTNLCTQGRETVNCSFTGENLVIGFSAPFLIDICSTITTDNIIIRLCDPSRPGVFLPEEQAENTELVMLLMPMKVAQY